MSNYQKRFIEDMELHGYGQRTIECYSRALRQLEDHFKKPAEKVTEEDIRHYFLYNKNERKWARTTSTIALCGIKFFFEKTLQKEWQVFDLVRPKRETKLPVILSRKEVRTIFDNVKMPYHRACLEGIYSLGLRLQEGTNLKIADIDSDRMFVHIHRGKGNKDRFVPLPKRTLEIFRDNWKTHRNPAYLFPLLAGAIKICPQPMTQFHIPAFRPHFITP